MAKKQYSRKTPEERKEEIKALSATALSQIEKFTRSPEELKEYADFIANFHAYSTNNMALIREQFSSTRAVASFKDWKDKGYSVNKGEKGIKILSYTPITYFKNSKGEKKQISEATKEEKDLIKNGQLQSWKTNAFKIGHVFDVSQTNCPAEDLPKAFPNRQFNFQIEDGNNAKHLAKGIEKVAETLNVKINDMKQSELGLTELGLAKGVYAEGIDGQKREIVMNSRNTETQALATSIHELAHAKLHNSKQDGSKFSRATKEFQAELTSYIVCKHFGMDTSEKAIPYMASWTKNGEDIEEKHKAIEGVHNTSKEFIDIMDQVITQEKEKELSQEVEGFKEEQEAEKSSEGTETTFFSRQENHSEGACLRIYTNEEDLFKSTTAIYDFDLNAQLISPNIWIKQGRTPAESTWIKQEDLAQEAHVLDKELIVNDRLNPKYLDSFISNWNEYKKGSNKFRGDDPNEGLIGFKVPDHYQVEQVELPSYFKVPTNDTATVGITGLYPKDPEEVAYCDMTGEPIAQDQPYYHLDNGMVVTEEAHALIYTPEEWAAINTDEGGNYWSEYYYDVPEEEMTTEKPEVSKSKDVYYYYDGNDHSKPVRLGTISEITDKAKSQEADDRFSYSREVVRNIAHFKYHDKEMFNNLMEKDGIMKNPKLSDFQKVNEKNGLDKNAHMEDIIKQEKREKVALKNQIER